MLLQYKGVEFRTLCEERGELPRRAEKEVHADREVCRVEERAPATPYQALDPGQLGSPAGRAGDGRNSGLDQPLEIAGDGIGPGELDRDVHSGEPLAESARRRPRSPARPMTLHGMATLLCERGHARPILPLPTIAIA